MGKPSVQRSLPPMEVQRLDAADTSVQKMDLDDVPLQMAKSDLGRALQRMITRTDSALKDFGDPSHVKRICDGEFPSVIARAWVREDTRLEFVLALADASGLFDRRIGFTTRRKRRTA